MKTADETAKVTEEKAAETKEEQVEVMEAAGTELKDGELDSVTGGMGVPAPAIGENTDYGEGTVRYCPVCHQVMVFKKYSSRPQPNVIQFSYESYCANPKCSNYNKNKQPSRGPIYF